MPVTDDRKASSVNPFHIPIEELREYQNVIKMYNMDDQVNNMMRKQFNEHNERSMASISNISLPMQTLDQRLVESTIRNLSLAKASDIQLID